MRSVTGVLEEVHSERVRQDLKWGQQNHRDGTGDAAIGQFAEMAKKLCEDAACAGNVTWYQILREEVLEAFAESDPAKLREELIQVAAVAAAWVEAIDRRAS